MKWYKRGLYLPYVFLALGESRLCLQESFLIWICFFTLERSGLSTSEPTLLATLPVKEGFPQAISRMGFCFPCSYLNSITLTLESQDPSWRRYPKMFTYQALQCSSETFHLVLSWNFQGLTSHSLRRESVAVFVYLHITNCSFTF